MTERQRAAERLLVAHQQFPFKNGKKEADGRAAERRMMARDLAIYEAESSRERIR